MHNRCLLSALFLVFSLAVPGLGKNLPKAPKVLNIVDWGQIRAEYERHRHAAFRDGAGWKARNFGQQWLERFDGRGISVEPDGEKWQWGLELVGVGGKARVSTDVNRVTYRWGDDLDEWFVNGTRGLEHGFTVRARREIRLTVRGGLHARAIGAGVEFVDAGGTPRVKYTELSAMDADGKAMAARMKVEGGAVVLMVDDRGARYPVTIDPIAQQAYLKASNTGSGDRFGYSVAVSGDTVVVGADGEGSIATGVNGYQLDNSAQDSGAAYVFVRNGATWTQQAYLKASNTGSGDRFGCSVAVSGDTVVVGAKDESSNATGVNGDQSNDSAQFSGAAYVFVRSGATWTQQAYFKASNTGANDNFGWSVAVSGDTVVVGAIRESSNATGVNADQNNDSAELSGAAYVFVRSGATWTQQAYVKASNTGANDVFGYAVAVSGDTVVVGAPNESSNATGVNGSQSGNSAEYSGAAYVFVRSGATWAQQAYVKASNTGANDVFGSSVAVSGDTVVVGAANEASNARGVNGSQSDNSATQSGAAYVFVRSGATWTQQAYLKASNTGAYDHFGYAVAVSGDTVVVGAYEEDSNATGVNGNQSDDSVVSSGAAYVFVRSGVTWTQQAYLKASYSGIAIFGDAVAVSGDTVVVGAPFEDSNATGVDGNQSNDSAIYAGAAYVFTTPACREVAIPVTAASATVAGDFTAGATVTVSATGQVSLANDDQYSTDANGVITKAPTLGTGAYNYFYGQAPQGAPLPGGKKLNGAFPFGALLGVLGPAGATSPPLNEPPFLVGSLSSAVVNYGFGATVRLFLYVNDSGYGNGSGQFTATIADGSCAAPTVPSLSTSALSLFNYTIGGAAPANQLAAVTAIRSGTIYPTGFVVETPAETWLTVTPKLGATPGLLTVSVSPIGLAAGTYSSTVKIHSTQAPAPSLLSVTLNVASAGCASFAGTGTQVGAGSGSGSLTVTAPAGCNWSAVSSKSWLNVTPGSSGNGNGSVGYSYAANPNGTPRSATLTVAGKTFTVTQSGINIAGLGLRYVPVTPCRIADTRGASGPFGGPNLGGATARDFDIIAGPCSIPPNALAYAMNLTVVPIGPLGFLSVWPAGQSQPSVSTLNSSDGRIKANAAIVPAGLNGAVTLFGSHPTHAIVDINGYFVLAGGAQNLAFYPITPCRLADTRLAAGTFGAPSLGGSSQRNFPVSGNCGIPASARAYALNLTVVPGSPLGFLSVWPAGLPQPGSSTLNAPKGTVTSNLAIIPAGIGGAITVIATNATDLIIDINGYFAPPGAGSLNFYTTTPCRILDTRGAAGPFGGPTMGAGESRAFTVPSSVCGIPGTAKSYSLNATVVPPAPLGFLTLWGSGIRPGVSTLNSPDGTIVANAALTPAGASGVVTAFTSQASHLILDINGYFQ